MNSIEFLYSLQTFGMKLGLRNISFLLDTIHNPQNTYPTIHIAGTNGKGSTAAMIAAILTASGYRTGLYTSPHLVRFNERIRINGEMITDKQLAQYTRELKPAILRTKATFFEATTAIALKHFADQHVDVAVVETGLGGRFDATNVLSPLLSIITTIGFDHKEQLGNTLRAIAYEKGGIMKMEIPCFTSVSAAEPLAQLKTIAHKMNAPLFTSHQNTGLKFVKSGISGVTVTISTKNTTYSELTISLAGNHQTNNAALALMVAEYSKKYCHFDAITEKTIREGLGNIRHYTGLRGRLECISKHPVIITDVAHNPEGMRTALQSLRQIIMNKPIVVFGVMKDKEYQPMVRVLSEYARLVVAVRPDTDRALESERIVREFHALGFPVLKGESVAGGIEIAKQHIRRDEALFVVGSHYVVGEAEKFLS